MSLLIPVEDEARPWSESTARAERLLHDADVLLDAAGIQLEEVVITDADDAESFGVLPLAARLAREHGLEVIESGARPTTRAGCGEWSALCSVGRVHRSVRRELAEG